MRKIEVLIDNKKILVTINRVESTYAWLSIPINDEEKTFRVYFPALRRRDPYCCNIVGQASYDQELLGGKIILKIRDELLNLRKKVMEEIRREEAKVPQEIIDLIKKCRHNWVRQTGIYPTLPQSWRQFKCSSCGLNATGYKCKNCGEYTPHIYVRRLRSAYIQTGDIFDAGDIEQWICTICLTPKNIRRGGRFAR